MSETTGTNEVIENGPTCDFCGKSQDEVGKFVKGTKNPNGETFICSSCAELASDIHNTIKMKEVSKTAKYPTPVAIKEFLDHYIIGQEDAKRSISVAVVNHYKRLISQNVVPEENDPYEDVNIDKSNILILGPTGSGKTLIARTLAKVLNVPFAIGDATTLTEAGYVGEDVENLLRKLIQNANGDIELAERGIIFIDEIDKIGKTSQNVSITRDVSGEGVQQALLKMLEGTKASIPPFGGRKHPEQEYVELDTTNILFICGGAFIGIDDIIKKRLGRQRIGFNSEISNISKEELHDEVLSKVIPDDLIEFGMIPEFVGRLPVLATCSSISIEMFKKILLEPNDAIVKQYKKLFHMEKVSLEFTDDAINEIAVKAKAMNTGARGLRNVIERIMNPLMFDLPTMDKGSIYIVDKEVVRGKPIKKANIIEKAA